MTPEQVLQKFTPQHKQAWKKVSPEIAKARLKGRTWPSWCLIPEDIWSALRHGLFETNADIDHFGLQALPDFGTWRLTKGIYRLAEGFGRELMRTDLGDKIPVEVLTRMPEWCVYLDLRGLTSVETRQGAWVRVTIGYGGDMSIRGTDHHQGLKPHDLKPFHFEILADGSLQSAIDKHMETLSFTVRALADGFVEAGLNRDPDEEVRLMEEEGPARRELFETILKFLLYMCSDEPDVGDREEPEAKPTIPRPERHGKREIFVAASKFRTWDVGTKVAQKLRVIQDGLTGRTVTRHIRRAHWHGYWTGARGSDERRFGYRWLAPTVVGTTTTN